MAREKICAYCRVSTKDKEQLSSIENQKSYFQREFGENERYELVELYCDCGRSGTSLKRPDFDRMILDAGIDKSQLDGDCFKIIGKPKFNRILTKNTSRFARNVSVDMLLKTLVKNGVYVDYVDVSLSTENSGNMFVLQMLQAADENESRDKSRKVLFGINEGIKRGNIHTHGNLYGYNYYPKPENRLEVIEEEAEVIRTMFDLYINHNMGVHRIRTYLSEHGMFARSGKPFTERGLRVMIQNETYTGRGVRKKFTNGTIFNKHATKETGHAIIFETDKIPAIIDIGTFEEAQSILESKVQHSTQKGIYYGKTEFAGKLICGCCGSLYYASSSDFNKSTGHRVRSYACKRKRTMQRDKDGNRVMLCNNPNISETALYKELESENYCFLLANNMLGAILFLKQVKKVLQSNMENEDTAKIHALTIELKEVETKIEQLVELKLDGKISKDILDRKGVPLQKQADKLREILEEYTKPQLLKQRDLDEVIDTINSLEKRCSEIYDFDSDTALVERGFKDIFDDIKHIVIDPFKNISVVFKSFDEVGRMVAKHTHILPDELKRDFEQLTADGNYEEYAAKYAQQSGKAKISLQDTIINLTEKYRVEIRSNVG